MSIDPMKKLRQSKVRFRNIGMLALIFSLVGLDARPLWAQSLEENLAKQKVEKEKEATNPYLAYKQKRRVEIKEMETCSWLVTYRKRIYDLTPLTRKGLERPLEGDMHTVLRRVPESEEHLEKISKNTRDAKVHTAIATFALATLLVTRIVQSGNPERGKQPEYMALNLGAGLLFLRAVYAGYELKQDTKQELVQAVQEFNNVSQDPILPYEGGL